MMTMPVTLGAGKAGDQNRGPKRANHADHVCERNIVTLPLLKCFRGILGEAKVRNSRKPLFYAVVPIRTQQLQCPQNAQHVEQITSQLILSALAAIESKEQD